MAWFAHGYHSLGSGVDQPRRINSRVSAIINRLTAHSDQASQVAARVLTPPTP